MGSYEDGSVGVRKRWFCGCILGISIYTYEVHGNVLGIVSECQVYVAHKLENVTDGVCTKVDCSISGDKSF